MPPCFSIFICKNSVKSTFSTGRAIRTTLNILKLKSERNVKSRLKLDENYITLKYINKQQKVLARLYAQY